jgi:alpha-1,6-mannosyltransferase
MRPLIPTTTTQPFWNGLALLLLGVTSTLFLVWGSHPQGNVQQQLLGVLLAASLGAAVVAWVAMKPRFDEAPLWWVLGLALVLRLIAVQASPLLEDDHYRYLWDGLRTATALDPYRLTPSAFFADQQLPLMWQDVLSGINNPDIATLYGPVLQGFFALAYAIAPAKVGAVQCLLLLVDMGVLLLLARSGVRARWLLVYAIHPLVLREAMASAHPDGLVALFLLLAMLAWKRRAPAWVGVLLGLAVSTKVVALVALPMLLCHPQVSTLMVASEARRFWLWALRLGAGFVITLALLYAPFVWVGGSDMASLATFGNQWRFNPLLFRGFEWLLPANLARPVAALVVVLVVAGVTWSWWRTKADGGRRFPPVHLALILLLLFSPVVNPWYWLWALAPAMMVGARVVAVVALFAVLSYLNTTVVAEAGWMNSVGGRPYQVSVLWAVIQVMVLALAWWLEIQYRHRAVFLQHREHARPLQTDCSNHL